MIPIIGTFTFSSECRSHCKYRSREKRSLCLLLRRSSCLPFVAAESSFVLHFAVVWLKPKNLLVSEGQLRYMQNFTSKVSIYIYYFTAPQEDKRVLLFLSKTRQNQTRQNLTPADIILIFSMRGIISRLGMRMLYSPHLSRAQTQTFTFGGHGASKLHRL